MDVLSVAATVTATVTVTLVAAVVGGVTASATCTVVVGASSGAVVVGDSMAPDFDPFAARYTAVPASANATTAAVASNPVRRGVDAAVPGGEVT